MSIQGLSPLNWAMYTIQEAQDSTTPETYQPKLAKILIIALPIFESFEIAYQIINISVQWCYKAKDLFLHTNQALAKNKLKKIFSDSPFLLCTLTILIYAISAFAVIHVSTKQLMSTIYKIAFYTLNILVAPCIALVDSKLNHQYHQKLKLILTPPQNLKDLKELIESQPISGVKKIIKIETAYHLIRKSLVESIESTDDTEKRSKFNPINFYYIIENVKLYSYIETYIPKLFKELFQLKIEVLSESKPELRNTYISPLSIISAKDQKLVENVNLNKIQEFIVKHPSILLYEVVGHIKALKVDLGSSEKNFIHSSFMWDYPVIYWTFLRYIMKDENSSFFLDRYPFTRDKCQVIYKDTMPYDIAYFELGRFIEALKSDKQFIDSDEAVEVGILLLAKDLLQVIATRNKYNFLHSISRLIKNHPLICDEIMLIKARILGTPIPLFLSKHLASKSILPYYDTTILTT